MKLTRTTFFLGCLVGGLGAGAWPLLINFFQSPARSETKLLPFQGRLTDAAGAAIADGAKVVEFKMYDSPTGGNVKWAGEVHKLSVNGGLVNTMLGSKNSLVSVDFAAATFLQITVDANGDGAITAADPPLLPRQSVVPTIYANEAGNSRTLNGFTSSDLAVPSGTILPFGGETVPLGFLLCDGTTYPRNGVYAKLFAAIDTAYGTESSADFKVPDLRGVFVRGRDRGMGRDPDANARFAFNTGGKTGDALGSGQGSEFAAHSHGVNDPGHVHLQTYFTSAGGGGHAYLKGSGDGPSQDGSYSTKEAKTGVSIQSTGGHETRPYNIYVNYIIKI